LPTGQITEHFTWGEARCHCSECSGWGDEQVQAEIRKTAAWAEEIRTILGWPVHINSWYRCRAYQHRINPEVTDSQHCLGKAIDVTVKQLSPSTVQKILAKRRELVRGLGRYSGFTHADRRDGPPATWRG
jgi:uncharacterized protein YcbK (DUF882 family)